LICWRDLDSSIALCTSSDVNVLPGLSFIEVAIESSCSSDNKLGLPCLFHFGGTVLPLRASLTIRYNVAGRTGTRSESQQRWCTIFARRAVFGLEKLSTTSTASLTVYVPSSLLGVGNCLKMVGILFERQVPIIWHH